MPKEVNSNKFYGMGDTSKSHIYFAAVNTTTNNSPNRKAFFTSMPLIGASFISTHNKMGYSEQEATVHSALTRYARSDGTTQ